MSAKQIMVTQGSDEWHALRRIKIGASNAAALCGKHPFKTKRDVYGEMVIGKASFVNAAMRRGTNLEPEARDWYNKHFGHKFEPAVFINDAYPYMMASLDGWDEEDDTILEIKAPGEKVFNECLQGYYPEYWSYQREAQFLVTGKSRSILLIWKGEGEYIMITCYPTKKIMEEIRAACEKFYNEHLLEFQSPESEEIEYDLLEMDELEAAYLDAKKTIAYYQSLEKEYRDEIISGCKGPTKTKRLRIVRSEPKGAINYKIIPELQGVDLENYRGPRTVKWSIYEIDTDKDQGNVS